MGSDLSPDDALHVDTGVPKELLQQIMSMLLSYWDDARSKDTPVVALRNDTQLRDEFARAGVPLSLGDVQVWRDVSGYRCKFDSLDCNFASFPTTNRISGQCSAARCIVQS